MNLDQVKEIYFIGIGGIGMSAAAALASSLGYRVSGSDQKEVYPPATSVLSKNQILYSKGYQIKNIKNPDLVVIGAAETPDDNPEVKEVVKRGISFISYPELLNFFLKDKFRIIVAGTHGKTTTSFLTAWALAATKSKAGFFVGGYGKDFKTNFLTTESKYFVIEGDEYYSSFFDKKPKFLHYHPSLLVITNLDMDHYDYYKNIGELLDKFKKLIKSIPPDGVIVACHDDSNVKKLLKNTDRKVIWYGLKGNQVQWKGEKISYSNNTMRFMAKNLETKEKEEITMKLIGEHNVLNCLATIATLDYLQIPVSSFKNALEEFQGSSRRFELKEEINGIIVIDDYAHHPTAVKATLAAARAKYPNQKIWAVFEPHTFSRTKATLAELAQSFSAADEVIIPDIYPAREKFKQGTITGKEVVSQIAQFQKNVHYLPVKENVLDYLSKNLKTGDVVIIMAVGDFNQVADLLINKLKNGNP